MMVKGKRQAPVKKNANYEVTIEDLTYEGLGVAKVDGFPVFVHDALPGESCAIRVVKVLKKFAFAIVKARHQSSPDRVPLRDKDGLRTGTMPLQHLAYPAQLSFKRQQVINSLHKFGLDQNLEVKDTIGMEEPWAYRNKAQVPVAGEPGQLYTGFYKRRSHEIIPVKDYQIQLKRIDETLQTVIEILNRYQLTAYQEQAHRGLLRFLCVRQGEHTGEVMVILIINGQALPHEEEIVAAIREEVPGLVSLVLNSNEERTNVIMGKENRILYGEDRYHDQILGLDFAISSHSFFQVNTNQAEKLYQAALEAADLQGHEYVMDAYCGIGSISLCLAQKAKHVYGVEIVEDAIDMARENAAANGLENTSFQAGDAGEVMPNWVKAGIPCDVLVVDPPRKGLSDAFIEASLELDADRIVYVSCNPASLARDLAKYTAAGYQIQSVQPVDLFPQTTHVESVVLMTRML
ncbi:23S rRNA (uracil(1939)-C(5))-methyltransferase RlmD [Aerococcus sanguinicola]|nr:23S rRNA (uracil(1939)-C(5))-methyltransferase RlmD [Aerococcus sanguinicola]